MRNENDNENLEDSLGMRAVVDGAKQTLARAGASADLEVALKAERAAAAAAAAVGVTFGMVRRSKGVRAPRMQLSVTAALL